MPQSSSAHFTLFADDTTITCTESSYVKLVEKTNSTLAKVHDWTRNNRLSFNTKKTTALLFSNRIFEVVIPALMYVDGSPVFFSNSVKFLGVEIDNNLNFSIHVNHICSKLSKTIGLLFRIARTVPNYVLINIYHSLIYPYLIYLSLIHI